MLWLILALSFLFAPHSAQAVTLLPPCTATGDCGITDILATGLNLTEYLLGISGAVALLFFVWGGFQYVLAGINMGDVNKAKDTLKNAVIGIFVIFFAGVLVNFTSAALTGGKTNSKIPVVGQSCGENGTSGIYVSVPAGVGDATHAAQPEDIECLSTCSGLVSALTNHNRPDAGTYGCFATDDPGVGSCVRGLCTGSPAGYACCSCPAGGCTGSSK